MRRHFCSCDGCVFGDGGGARRREGSVQEGWRARDVDDGSVGTTHARRDGWKEGGEGKDAEGKPWWTDGRRLTRGW